MFDSYYKKTNLLSPEYDKELIFKRDSFSVGIVDAFYLNLHNYDYAYTHLADKHNVYELNMITNGCSKFEFSNGKTLTVTNGNFIIIPPQVKHKIISETSDLSRVKFFFTYNSIENNDTDTGIFHISQQVLKKKNIFPYNEQMKTLLSLMLDLSENILPEYKASIFLYATAYILEALRIVANEKVIKESKTSKIINRATEFIQLNASATLSVQDVADFVGISSKQLTRIFCNNLGISPGKHIKDCRISKISDFLLFSNLSIADIAETMEYPDYASLVNAFKRAKGVTPTQYRNKTKANKTSI